MDRKGLCSTWGGAHLIAIAPSSKPERVVSVTPKERIEQGVALLMEHSELDDEQG